MVKKIKYFKPIFTNTTPNVDQYQQDKDDLWYWGHKDVLTVTAECHQAQNQQTRPFNLKHRIY